ncbi:hypothetical protein FOZ62_009429 [Perkinsus olseni]|uniref:PDZ domain-containing protein n=1 Tax=Perkinsus olseni TaxID=32597 RepID=A0A7J6UG43_PEROL|nr:hypothetical protein FOZ62_009429 [Perkinsus olseni]
MGNTLASIESSSTVSRLETFSTNMFDQCCRRPESSEWLNEVTVVGEDGQQQQQAAAADHTTPKATPAPMVATPSTASVAEKEEGHSIQTGGNAAAAAAQTLGTTTTTDDDTFEDDTDDDVADERIGAPEEDIEANCFKIDIQRIPGVRLGIDVDHSDPRWLVVDRVTPEGSVDLWNKKAPPGQKLQKGDIIVRVNGSVACQGRQG